MRDLQSLQHQSRAKYSVSALTMAAPLVLTCCMVSLLATLYTISEERMTFVNSQEVVSFYCTKVLYVHLLNGVCTRGQTTDVDVDASCIQWTDSSDWEAKDDFNLFMVNNGTSGAMQTDLADEAKNMWPFIGLLCQMSVGLAFGNLLIAAISLDTDILYTMLKIDDPDFLVLMSSFIFTVGAFGCVGYSGYLVQFQSEIVEAESWKNQRCEMTTDPTLGAYIFLIGGFFAFLSSLVSVTALLRLYVIVPLLKRRKAVRDSGDDDEEAADKANKNKSRDLEAASPTPSNVAGQPGAGAGAGAGNDLDFSDNESKSDSDETGASVKLSSDGDSDYGEEQEREVRLPGKAGKARAESTDFGSPVSIVDSVEGSLKLDSPRTPSKPSPPTKPPRPVKSKKKETSGAAGGTPSGTGMKTNGTRPDREVEAVPFSPPSPNKKEKEASIPGSTLAERTKDKPRKTPTKTPAATGATDGGGISDIDAEKEKKDDKDEEIDRLKVALAAAEAAKMVAADVQAGSAARKLARKVRKKKDKD